MNAKTETGYKMRLIDQRSRPSVTEQNVAGMNVKFYTSKNETAQNWMREIFHGISRMSKILLNGLGSSKLKVHSEATLI